MCVCVYVRMYVCEYVCIYVCMYVRVCNPHLSSIRHAVYDHCSRVGLYYQNILNVCLNYPAQGGDY